MCRQAAVFRACQCKIIETELKGFLLATWIYCLVYCLRVHDRHYCKLPRLFDMNYFESVLVMDANSKTIGRVGST